MTGNEFGQGLTILKGFYTNWNLDITNPLILEIWYENFKHLDSTAFQHLIKRYCKVNRFAPNSPYDILDLIPKLYTPNEAWELVVDVIKRSKDNAMFLNIMYKQHPELYTFVKGFDIDNVKYDSYGNKCLGYELGKQFKRDYQTMLDSQQIKYVGNQLVYNNQLLLQSNN